MDSLKINKSNTYKKSIKEQRISLVHEEEYVYKSRIKNELPHHKKPFKLIDLFSGAGGMTLGFSEAFGRHFKMVWANDFNKYCVETYNSNFGTHCLSGDIVDILIDPSMIFLKQM